MADGRPTRWRKAREESNGFRPKRSLVEAVLGAAVSALALLAAGFPHDAEVIGFTIGGSAVAAALIMPTVELGWNWLQAPMRILQEDVIVIRERIEQLQAPAPVEAAPRTQSKAEVRLNLINHRRVGEEIVAGMDWATPAFVGERWADSVIEYLSGRLPVDDIESFITAGEGTANARLPDRLEVLRLVIDRLGSESDDE